MTMLFMVMHKVDAKMEAGTKPPPELIARMGALIGETVEAGRLHNAAGLKPSAERVRLRCSGGQCTITRGPLTGHNELIAGFAMLQVKSMDEAIAWTRRIAEVLGDVEIDVGPIVEPWDIGVAPKPEGELPLRCLAMHKADAKFEAGTPASPAQSAKLQQLFEEMRQAGVLLASETLKPSARGVRLTARAGKHSVVDGPFTESKELVAGFSIVRLDTMEEALAWTKRYADILGDCEVDIREVSHT
jgi:hypothetical protein